MSLVNYIEKRRLEKEKELKKKIRAERIKNVTKVVAGLGVGASLGILFAPKSGKETREDIAKAAKDGVNYVTENVTEAAKVVKEKAMEIKEAVSDKVDAFNNRNMTEIVPETIDEVIENVEEIKSKVEEKIEK